MTIKTRIEDELRWLASSSQGLADEAKNITENSDLQKLEFHIYHINKARAKIELLRLLDEELL